MRRFSQSGTDSLDLLLDTMCNTFGGIILIAVLVALLTQTTQVNQSNTQDVETAEMLERRIAQAEADLAGAQALAGAITISPESAVARLVSRRASLKAALARAQNESSATASAIDSIVTEKSADAGKEIAAMNKEAAEVRRQITDLQNKFEAQEQNSARLRERIDQLGTGIADAQKGRIEKLRFPKERAATKISVPVIFRHNRFYPLTDLEGNKNTESIRWEPVGHSDGEKTTPIEAKGWDAASAAKYVASAPNAFDTSRFYFTFYVYPDSVEIFKATEEQAAAAGCDFGWEPA